MKGGEVVSIAARIVQWLAGDGQLLLVTDYDGTLTPIVASPDDAWLPQAVRDDLQVLARGPRIHVGVVSGRDLAGLRGRVLVPEAVYGGCHGLDINEIHVAAQRPDALDTAGREMMPQGRESE